MDRASEIMAQAMFFYPKFQEDKADDYVKTCFKMSIELGKLRPNLERLDDSDYMLSFFNSIEKIIKRYVGKYGKIGEDVNSMVMDLDASGFWSEEQFFK